MPKIVVFASGGGSNFEAIANAFNNTAHSICCLICDRRHALAIQRAMALGIPTHYVSYYKRERTDAEDEIGDLLTSYAPDLIVLAGFMRIFSKSFANALAGKVINIHPALLPRHPGAHGIEESYESGDLQLGVTIHFVDGGVDTGPIIRQESFLRLENESMEAVEQRIHTIEHRIYPEVILSLIEENALNQEVQK